MLGFRLSNSLVKGCTYPRIKGADMLHSDKVSQPLVRTDVYLSAEQRDTMKDLGRQQDISMAELIRRVLDKHLRRVKKQAAAK